MLIRLDELGDDFASMSPVLQKAFAAGGQVNVRFAGQIPLEKYVVKSAAKAEVEVAGLPSATTPLPARRAPSSISRTGLAVAATCVVTGLGVWLIWKD